MSGMSPQSSTHVFSGALLARVANWSRIKVAAAVVALLMCSGSTATAAIIAEVIGCAGQTCGVEPIGGAVDVDPTSFTLDVEWSQILHYLDFDDRGLMRLTFEFTGEHEGTEHFGNITLLDSSGNPIPALSVQFDDSNPIAGILTASFDIFGPEAFLGGFTLGPSDGSGVDTLRWTRAAIFPTELVQVPEPSALLLLSAGLGIAVVRRHWRRACRLSPPRVLAEDGD